MAVKTLVAIQKFKKLGRTHGLQVFMKSWWISENDIENLMRIENGQIKV